MGIFAPPPAAVQRVSALLQPCDVGIQLAVLFGRQEPREQENGSRAQAVHVLGLSAQTQYPLQMLFFHQYILKKSEGSSTESIKQMASQQPLTCFCARDGTPRLHVGYGRCPLKPCC